ncbi:ATP-binding protein [Bacillus sp. JJ1566]|uniref:AAA family ATPase n=1 Tax=Bacillus sp. JJ1566 TaxID=3122961 RepID=UPI002FFE4DDE
MEKQLPKLVLIIGVAGSGKTEVGKQVSKHLNYVYIDKDTLTRPYTEKFLKTSSPNQDPNDRESAFYLEHVRPLEYLISLNVAEENLRLGNHVVISAPFLSEAKMTNWIKKEVLVGRRLMRKIDVKVIWVESDRETERKRIIQRGAERDKWKLFHWDQYTEGIDNFKLQWGIDQQNLFVFDNRELPSVPFSKQMEELIKWIEN